MVKETYVTDTSHCFLNSKSLGTFSHLEVEGFIYHRSNMCMAAYQMNHLAIMFNPVILRVYDKYLEDDTGYYEIDIGNKYEFAIYICFGEW